MSKLTEMFKNLSQMLHHGPSMAPLWEQMIAEIVALEQRIIALEGMLNNSVQGLDPELVAELKDSYALMKRDRERREKAATALKMATEAVKSPVPQAEPVQVIDATTQAVAAPGAEAPIDPTAPVQVIDGETVTAVAADAGCSEGEAGKTTEQASSSS